MVFDPTLARFAASAAVSQGLAASVWCGTDSGNVGGDKLSAMRVNPTQIAPDSGFSLAS
jgi:hypothetical protein